MANTVLWIYIVLLIVGGMIGFFKAKSKPSLIMSLAFAIPLILCATNILRVAYLVDILLVVLLVFFAMRYAKGKKFMPAGLMTIASVATLALRHI